MRERGWKDPRVQDLEDMTPPCPFLHHHQSRLLHLTKCCQKLTTLTNPTMMEQAFTSQDLHLTSRCLDEASLKEVTCSPPRPPDRQQTPS